MVEEMKISKVDKLVPNLNNKNVVHIQALDKTWKHGLMLKKIHQVIKFNQSAWLKAYIDLNTRWRIQATNEFEKDFFKLINNSVFDKAMENIHNHKDIRLVRIEKIYLP